MIIIIINRVRAVKHEQLKVDVSYVTVRVIVSGDSARQPHAVLG